MAEAKLIFTTDYEIFGNGSGSVEHCMIKPTEDMARLLEKHGARMTVFFDVCEYWAFKAEFEKGTLSENWAQLIESQLQDLVQRGHDVQLHFHPQWLDYAFDGQDWKLNFNLWRIGVLKYEDETHPERGLNQLFKRGKETLETLLQPVKSDYRCHIFRAGAWSMQPETNVLRAMRENGFDIDSTVVPGLKFEDSFTKYNFTAAPKDRPHWTIQSNLCQPELDGAITEIPIFSAPTPLVTNAAFLWMKSNRKIAFKPDGCSGTAIATEGKGKWRKILETITTSRKMFTFGDATPAEEMKYMVGRALREVHRMNVNLPVVAISHPKTFANTEDFDAFLAWCVGQKKVEFSTYDNYLKGE